MNYHRRSYNHEFNDYYLAASALLFLIMEMKEFLTFINEQVQRLDKLYATNDPERMVLSTTVKLMEEVGELSSEVLATCAIQRKEKMEKHSPQALAKECADVIITTFILSHRMGIDINQVLDQKVAELKQRFASMQ